jgi:hypothetical protein
MTPERILVPIAVRCAVLGGLVLLITVPVYVFVEPAGRVIVVRLAVALVLGVALLQLRSAHADRLAASEASAMDDARDQPGMETGLPLRFLDLMHDVRAALRSRRYFDRVLWPRLAAMADRPLARPPVRPGRGPSLASLDKVITAIESQQ